MDESTIDSLYWPDCIDFCTCDSQLRIGDWLVAATRVAETPAELASLWAIRIALGLINGAIVFQSDWIRAIGLVGVGILLVLSWQRRKRLR